MKKGLLLAACHLLALLSLNAQWSLTGNSISSGQFLGTTNAQSLVFKVGNSWAGYIDVSNSNTSFGLYTNSSTNILSKQNSAFGMYALQQNTTGYANVAVGYLSLPQNSSGNTNTGVGIETLYANTTGSSNTAIGSLAMYHNTTGYENNAFGVNALQVNTTGIHNNAFGSFALFSNINGNNNCVMGDRALYSNTSGSDNIAFGQYSSYLNTTGSSNIAMGNSALYNNSTGSQNIGIGVNALKFNTTGNYNTAVGYASLGSTNGSSNNSALGFQALLGSTGGNNTAMGFDALLNTSTGADDVGVGANAGNYNTTGSQNVFVGSNAGPTVSYPGLTNAIAIGYNAYNTASNQAVIGNPSVSSIGGYATSGWVVYPSDVRFKKNIKENVPGLEFIMLLRPVTYTVDVTGLYSFLQPTPVTGADGKVKEVTAEERTAIQQKEKKVSTGFIAQEVEASAKKIGYDFSGVVAPADSRGLYGLGYAAFVVPLVKAVQQLSGKHDSLSNVVSSLQSQINDIQDQINKLKAAHGGANTGNSPLLRQNAPNPFNSSTTISYFIPPNTGSAQLLLNNAAGQTIKIYSISAPGEGLTTISAGELASGTYSYTLVINGNKIDTKKMVITK